MRKIFERAGTIKVITGTMATFAAAFSILTCPDINLFYSHYFAGMAGGIALSLQLDDDD